ESTVIGGLVAVRMGPSVKGGMKRIGSGLVLGAGFVRVRGFGFGAGGGVESSSESCFHALEISSKRAASPPRSGWCCLANAKYARRICRLDAERVTPSTR